jgi:hypothetical protein
LQKKGLRSSDQTKANPAAVATTTATTMAQEVSLLLLGQAGMTGRRRLRGLTVWQCSSTGVLQLT